MTGFLPKAFLRGNGKCQRFKGNSKEALLSNEYRIGGSDGQISDLRQGDSKELEGSTDNFCVAFFAEEDEPIEQDAFICAEHKCHSKDKGEPFFCANSK